MFLLDHKSCDAIISHYQNRMRFVYRPSHSSDSAQGAGCYADPLTDCGNSSSGVKVINRYQMFSDTDDSDFYGIDHSINTERPDQDAVESFLDMSKFVTREPGREVLGGKFSFNWLSPNDYVANWHHLDEGSQTIFNKLMTADSSMTNSYYYGLKEHDSFPEYLLLLLGADIQNILPGNKTDMISANLRYDGFLYSPEKHNCRALCPRTAMAAQNDFRKKFDPEAMFHDFDASILVIDSPASLHEIQTCSDEHRDAYMAFFRENSKFLAKQANKRHIYSYIYSHEISVTSIHNRTFCPHTHVVVFYPKGTELQLSDMQDDLAKAHPDRCLDMDRTEGREGVHSSFSTIKDFCSYIFKVSNMAQTYRREFTYEKAQEINIGAVQCLHTLIELSTGTGDQKRRFQRTGCWQIAKHRKGGKTVRFVHPKLKTKNKTVKLPNISQSAASKIMIQPVLAGEDHEPECIEAPSPGPQCQKLQQVGLPVKKSVNQSISKLLIAPLEEPRDCEASFQPGRQDRFRISTPPAWGFQRIRAGPSRASPFTNRRCHHPFQRQQPQPAKSPRYEYL